MGARKVQLFIVGQNAHEGTLGEKAQSFASCIARAELASHTWHCMRLHIVSQLFALAFILSACGDDQDPAGARVLWDSVHAQNYRDWARPLGYEMRVAANSPHSDLVDVYMNETLVTALANNRTAEWPVGSRLVKDGFDDDGELCLVAIMEKREDGWYWAEYDATGDSSYSGHPATCIDCHSVGDDFSSTLTLPR